MFRLKIYAGNDILYLETTNKHTYAKGDTMDTKKQITNWLDMQIGASAVQSNRLTINKKLELCNLSASNYIHINNDALRYIAKELNLDINVIERPDDAYYQYELQIFYKDVKFMCLENTEEYERNGGVTKTAVA